MRRPRHDRRRPSTATPPRRPAGAAPTDSGWSDIMHLMRRAIPMMLAAVALAACGGDGGETAPTDTAPADTGGATAPADTGTDTGTGDGDGAAEITIVDFTFSAPSEVSVGTTVTVTNEDSVSHTWTAEDGTFDSGTLTTGDTYEYTFEDPGTYDYVCNIHPSMTGTIEVTG